MTTPTEEPQSDRSTPTELLAQLRRWARLYERYGEQRLADDLDAAVAEVESLRADRDNWRERALTAEAMAELAEQERDHA